MNRDGARPNVRLETNTPIPLTLWLFDNQKETPAEKAISDLYFFSNLLQSVAANTPGTRSAFGEVIRGIHLIWVASSKLILRFEQ